jgi:hypothetical protein
MVQSMKISDMEEREGEIRQKTREKQRNKSIKKKESQYQIKLTQE